jgi:hypothetical protein
MAFWRCFLPMYPLGHNVSEISSTGMMRGEELLVLVVVENKLLLLFDIRKMLLADVFSMVRLRC